MPPILLHPPKSGKVSRSFYRRWTWRRQLAASGLRLSILALLLLAAWGGWYLANKGFGRQWRTRVVEELRKRGIDASVRKLTLDPFRGLVAQDVRIFDYKRSDKPLAVISEVALDINYAALLHHQPFLNAVDVRGADLTLPNPTSDPNLPKAQLKQFHAHVYFPPEQIFISQADGIFCGVRISATGQLIKRVDYKPSRVVSDEEWRERMELIQRVATELGRFNFAGGPPSLQVKFTGDLAEMENAHAEATLTGERIQRDGYEIKAFSAEGAWSERVLSLTKLEWTDSAGLFSSHATWNASTNATEFQASSAINLKQFLDAFGLGKFAAELNFSTAPALELSGSGKLGTNAFQVHALGHFAAENLTYKSVPLLSVAAEFSWDGARTMLREVRVRHESGELSADFLDAPGDFRLNLESSLNPTAFRALAPADLQQFLSEWEWSRSPTIRLTIRGTSRAPESWKGEGSVALARTRFRGVWMNSATAHLQFADGAISFTDLRIMRNEGVGTGAFTYDPIHHEVHVDNVKTTLRPADAIYWIEPDLFKVVAPYKFHAAPSLTANGLVQYRGGKNTHLVITIDAPGGMDYFFLGKTLSFEHARGNLLITDDRVQLSDIEGTLFGGNVRGHADISTAKGDSHYTASVEADGVDFPRLTDLYFKYETARGLLAGNYDFAGVGDDARTMRGSGRIKVSNGDVFAIPVFGPLSELIAAIIPGAGYSVAKQGTASFTIRDGVIHTDDFKVSGKLFGLVGRGDIYFLENRLDFDIRINAAGPGVLLTPVYKLFEYRGEGSLSKPNWHAKNF
ncbi:MAG: AsmA-like C-terminal region-containing protein [Chthoniobacterales bacterium]